MIAGLSMAPERLGFKNMNHERRDFVWLMSVITLARLIGQTCEFLRFLSSQPGLTFAMQKPWPWEAFSLYLNWSWRKTSLWILIISGYKRPFPWPNQINVVISMPSFDMERKLSLCRRSIRIEYLYIIPSKLSKELPAGKIHSFGKLLPPAVVLICLRNRNMETIHNVLV